MSDLLVVASSTTAGAGMATGAIDGLVIGFGAAEDDTKVGSAEGETDGEAEGTTAGAVAGLVVGPAVRQLVPRATKGVGMAYRSNFVSSSAGSPALSVRLHG
jgi:hypothetical protein